MDFDEYPFPSQPDVTGYCVFPPELEDDQLVLFHATPVSNADSIVKDGFKIPDNSELVSVSFAKRSVGALTHAMNKRQTEPGEYIIFAVRYQSLDREGLSNNLCDIHDYKLDPMPQIIGSCVVPTSYQHI